MQRSLDDILDLDKLDLPPVPKVKEIEWFPFTDSVGDPAVRITLVIPDDTPPEQRESKVTWELEDCIRKKLREEGVEEYPYLRTLTRADLDWAEENKYY